MFLDIIVHNFTCQLPDGVGGCGRVKIHPRFLIYPHPPIVPEKKKYIYIYIVTNRIK